MNHRLQVNLGEHRLEEPGFVLHHMLRRETDWLLLADADADFDDQSQALRLRPRYTLADTTLADWQVSHADGSTAWEETANVFGEAGTWLHQRVSTANAAWSAASRFALDANEAFHLSFCLMTPPPEQIDHALRIDFGGRYRLRLAPGGDAELSRLTDGAWTVVGHGPLLNDPRDLHNRQVILTVTPTKDRYLRFASNFQPDGWVFAEDEERIETEMIDAGTETERILRRVTQAGPVAISGNGGAFAFSLRRRDHAASASILSPVITMPYATTQTPQAWVEWEPVTSGTLCAVEVLTEDGLPWEQPPAKNRFRYRLTIIGDTAGLGVASPCVYAVKIIFPHTIGYRQEIPVDLAGVALAVDETLSLDSLGQSLDFAICDELGAHRDLKDRANMAMQWSVDGTPRFTGLTDEPTFVEGPRELTRISFRCSDMWKKLRNARLWHTIPYDGYSHSEVFKAICRLAGFEDADLDVTTDAYCLPSAQTDEDPLFAPRYGQGAAEFLDYIRENFSGWRMGARPDGRIFYEPDSIGASVGTFYATTAGAGPTGKKVYSWSERINEDAFANWIIVCGREAPKLDGQGNWVDGKPVAAWWRDDASYSNQAYAYYVGEWRPLLYVDSALRGQAAANWVCAKLAAQLGHFLVEAEAEVDFVPTLVPGMVVTIEGKGDWQVRSMQTRIVPKLERSRLSLRKVP
jgi:hypothetical protein